VGYCVLIVYKIMQVSKWYLSISSNLGKLFNKFIYKRLLTFMKNKNLISKNQIGFKEKSRTVDHIFTLKTIIDEYKQKSELIEIPL
jgi:hypothetical protein